jgi:hypothetical protein
MALAVEESTMLSFIVEIKRDGRQTRSEGSVVTAVCDNKQFVVQ